MTVVILFPTSSSAVAQSIQPAGATGNDSRMAEGLRSRRLFDLAEHFCNSRLLDTELNPEEKTSLILELLRTQTARAAVSSQDEAESRWDTAKRTATEFISVNGNQPRILLVEVQNALIYMTHGRLIQQQIDADIIPASQRDRALEQLQICNTELDATARKIKQLIPERRARQPLEFELTLDQLQTLESNVQFQSAMCTLNRARLYPEDDQLNRINALGMAQEGFDAVRRRTSSEQPVWWQNELATCESHRLLGNVVAAENVLNSLPMDEATDATKRQVLRERMLNAIRAGDSRAGQIHLQRFISTPSPDAQLSLAAVQLMMSLSKLDNANSRTWQSQAAQLVSGIEKNHGAYWGRLAELQLIGTPGTAVAGGNPDPEMTGTDLDILLRVGDQAWRKGNLDDALKAYQQAVATAETSGNGPVVFATSVSIYRILEQQQKHDTAALGMVEIANRFPDQPGASAVHLRGCWNLAQEFTRTDGGETDLEIRYVTLLNENISSWPDAQTTDQARVWLAGHFQEQHKWSDAVEAWMAVSPTGRWSTEAIRQSGRCMVAQLEQVRRSGKSTAETAGSYLSSLTRLLQQIGSTESDMWTSQHTAIAISLATVKTGYGSGNVDIVSILQRAATQCTADESEEVNVWLVVALADQEPDASAAIAETILAFATSLPALEKCEAGLSRLINRRPDCSTAHQARLAVSRAALALELDETQTNLWRTRQSQTLVSAGRHTEAVELLEGLVAQNPDSATLQMQLGRCLSSIEGDDATRKALTQWRRIARRLRPNSDNWYEAKYHVALLLDRSGSSADALKVLEYLRATGADWSSARVAEKLDALYRRLQSG